jgi:hypothetical protein
MLAGTKKFLGDRERSFSLFTGSKNLSWRPQTLFSPVHGLQESFLATANALFPCSWAPRIFLGDRKRSFPLFSGSKNLSWRPQTLFSPVLGLQESFLATANALFPCSRAPRTFLGDSKRSFPLFSGSKNLSWRQQTLFSPVLGLQEPFLATANTLFPCSRDARTFLSNRQNSSSPLTSFKNNSNYETTPASIFTPSPTTNSGCTFRTTDGLASISTTTMSTAADNSRIHCPGKMS